jgi:hypothetical protein
VAAICFAATSPGLSGLELAAPLGGWVDFAHERQVHVEPAGHSGHSDVCKLGIAACHSRLPSPQGSRLKTTSVSTRIPITAARSGPAQRRFSLLLPRAPPA